jgi:inhibitor of KinA
MTQKTNSFKCYPLGDAAAVIQLGDQISPVINARVRAICAYLDEYSFEGFIEYVPAFTTVTLYYEPWIINYTKLLHSFRKWQMKCWKNRRFHLVRY